MERIFLDGARLAERSDAMVLLEQALSLPGWWGKNLDALYDCLTGLGRPVCLELSNLPALRATPFGRRLLLVLRDAAADSRWLDLADGDSER